MFEKRRVLPLILGLVALPAVAAAQETELPDGVTQAMIEEGASLYAGVGLCAACHAADGSGSVGPSLIDDEWLHGDGSYEAIVRQITEGVAADKSKSGVPMPPKGGSNLTEEQVRAVAAYVWSIAADD
jgi:mono/diheme cytochrome c family protein